MQTMYDPPEPRWSCRGELSIASGLSYQVYQPFRSDEPVPEAWSIVPKDPRSQMTSPYGSLRGRKEALEEPVTFRDGSGGMQLNVHLSRTYSPASMRRFTLDKSPAPDATPRPSRFALRPENELSEKRGRSLQKGEQKKSFSRSQSRSKLSSDERSSRRVITDDISMVIRRRVLKGYGLENVGLPWFLKFTPIFIFLRCSIMHKSHEVIRFEGTFYMNYGCGLKVRSYYFLGFLGFHITLYRFSAPSIPWRLTYPRI